MSKPAHIDSGKCNNLPTLTFIMFDCSVDQEIQEKDKTKTCTINANAPPVYFTREADEHTVNIKYTYSVVWIVSNIYYTLPFNQP